MDNKFLTFLKSIEDISLRTPTDDEISLLDGLTERKLPEMFMQVYTKLIPAEEAEFSDFVFYGIDRIADENTRYIPGSLVLPYGLFTFASVFDGDAVCFDLNVTGYPVLQCSHELLEDNDEKITYSKYDGNNDRYDFILEFNYTNILKMSPKLADSFDEFVDKLIKDDAQTYSVTDIINMN